jgi:hypothetical protein
MGNLNSVNFYPDFSREDNIVHNTSTFIKYGLLEIGAFYNLDISLNESVLRPVNVTGVTPYTIYRGIKSDWVYESELGPINLRYPNGTQPNRVSGILVNGVFFPTGTAVSGASYYVDYARGQVVFNSGLPSNFVVRAAPAIRYVQVYQKDSYEYKEINYSWQNLDNPTGVPILTDRINAFLPAVFVGIDKIYTKKGISIGSRAKYTEAKISFDIVTTNHADRKRISDICYMLETKSFPYYDLNVVKNSLPLFSNGSISPSGKNWDLLASENMSGWVRFDENAMVLNSNDPMLPFQRSIVTIGLEIASNPV